MADRLELLSTESHANLRMHPAVDEDHPHFVPLYIHEFMAASATCPIFLAKDAMTGRFYAGAMFGFQPGEMLADSARRGTPTFRPLEIQRIGFFASGENIAIDTTSPRFSDDGTLSLFDPSGTPSKALRQIQRVIGEIAAGTDATRNFIAELLRLKMVEPIDISLSFDDGQTLSLDGLYCVSKEALAALDDSDTIQLLRSGYLQAAMCMIVSLGQVAIMAERRNARLTEPA